MDPEVNLKRDAEPVLGAESVASQHTGIYVNHRESRFGKFLNAVAIKSSSDSPAPDRWSNRDLDPVPPEDRNWHTYNYIMYWISDAFVPGNWRLGSSLLLLGLSWKMTLTVIALAHVMISIIITLNGAIGSRFHIGFAIQSRGSFGIYFSFVVVILRMIVSIFWYGVNTYTGAECVRSVIYAMAPNFRNIENHLPASANITTQMMICYFIYFCLVLPFHLIDTRKVRWLFTAKSSLTPIAGIGMMVWMIVKGHAITSPGSYFRQGNSVSGTKFGWAFMSGLNAMLGNYATLAVNINDFTRYAWRERITYVQLFIIPAVFIIMGFWGIVGASGSLVLYGEVLWDPLLMVDHWTSPGGRAAAFFCGLAFLFAQLCANISANCIAAANDMNALAPAYINIRRGQIITAFIGAWMLTPWNILTSAEGFLNFMSGYSIWLAPISAILLADFYVLTKQSIHVPDLYRPKGLYMYGNKYGTNWRAAVSFCIGFIPLLPGFAQSVSSSISLSAGAEYLYDLGYIYGFSSSFAVYIFLSYIWKPETLQGISRS